MWLIQMCDMTHSYVWHDPFLRRALFVSHKRFWALFVCCSDTRMTHEQGSFLWRALFVSHKRVCAAQTLSWLFYMCNVTHPYETWLTLLSVFMTSLVRVCFSFVYVAYLIHTCYMTHSHVWPYSFRHDSYEWHDFFGMTHSYAWQDFSSCLTLPLHMCGMTRSHV